MQFSSVLLASMVASLASAYSYVTVTANGATYVETITEASDLSTPAGAYITYKVITGTKGTNTYTKTIWSTVYTSSAAAETTSSAAEETSSAAAETSATATSSAAAETSAAVSSSAVSSSAAVSSYDAGAGSLGAAAGVVGFAGVAALLI